jgi:hypothetical protein
MLGFGTVTCAFCSSRVRRRAARRTQNDRSDYVCEACYERWDSSGRKCAACDTRVSGMQDIGLFAVQKALGHADCGGVRILRA